MGILVARFDKEKTGKKKNGAETIQRRIQTRKVGDGNQWGKMSGISIRIKKTHRTKGTRATTAKVLFSNLRCMKCIATNAAFHTAKITNRAASSIFGKPKYTIATSMTVSARRI